MKPFVAVMAGLLFVLGAVAQDAGKQAGKQDTGRDAGNESKEKQPVTAETADSVLDFTVADIDGDAVDLTKYKGKVLLIVNVASKCGLTPQYEQLQALHTRYAERGLAVLGFPANDFREQEPGTNAEIKTFCRTKYGVEFDMFSKVKVTGDDKCELYKFITAKDRHGELGGELRWNFTKFLVSRDGKVVKRFEPTVKPDAPEVVKAIEAALDEKP